MECNQIHRGKLIGRGGFSDVFTGTYNNFAVAIKIFRVPCDVEYSKFRDICFQEASILKSLSHENVLKFVAFIEQKEMMEILLLTELIEGGSMKRFCKDTFVHINDKKKISKLCWKGLAFLHQKGVCHKDIKPDNILVSNDFLNVKIGDFGLSELKTIATAYSTNVKGTCMYYPPEFASDNGIIRHPTYSDVYSMGASLCELFSGHHFWATSDGQSKSDAQIMYILITQKMSVQTSIEPTEPSCWKYIPFDIQVVLVNAVAPNYKKRKSAHEMFELFDKIHSEVIDEQNLENKVNECSTIFVTTETEPDSGFFTYNRYTYLIDEGNKPRNFYSNQEINPDDIVVERECGDGYFGPILKGRLHIDAKHIREVDVALKTSLNAKNVTGLQRELNMLLFVAQHDNIVTLLGVITKPNKISDLVIVTEYCQLGDLRNYISKRQTSKSCLEKPERNQLNCILDKNVLCLSSLLMYALQIANGAYYITHVKKLIHRNLDLQCMYLTEEHIVKIGSFGFAIFENMYEVESNGSLINDYLVQPESSRSTNAHLTIQSDVWTFGILLWDMFTLANNSSDTNGPKQCDELSALLISKKTFNFHIAAPNSLVELMKQCWHHDREQRPNFFQCLTKIQNELIVHSQDTYEYIAKKISLEKFTC